MTAAVVLLGVVVALLAVIVLSLLRSHAEILKALHDLGVTLDPFERGEAAPRTVVGVPAPRRAGGAAAVSDVAGMTPGGGATQIGVLGADQRTLLAFLTTGCLTCQSFWRSLAEPVDVGGARIVIVTKDPSDESESAVIKLAPRSVPVVMSTSAWDAYGVEVAPYFVLVDGQKGTVVGEGAAASWEQVQRLLTQAVADTSVSRQLGAEEALATSGIGPGHPSLRPPLQAPDSTVATGE
jgi:hypothetical protein